MAKVIGYAAIIVGTLYGQPWLVLAGQAILAADSAETARRKRSQARQAYNDSLQDRMVMVDLRADAPRTLVMGRVRAVEGVRRRWSSGTHNEKLTLIVSFAGHEIDAFETFYFNDTEISLDGSGYVQTPPYLKGLLTSETETGVLNGSGGATVALSSAPVTGSVTAIWTVGVGQDTSQGPCTVDVVGTTVTLTDGQADAPYIVNWQRSSGQPMARVRTYLGTAAQNVGADLAAEYPGNLTSTDKFAGIALAVVDLTYDPDVYPQGVPNITAVFRGAKCLDPRDDTTAWTENPALHAYHYARWVNGWAVPAEEIRTADIEAAADICETSTDFTLRKPDTTTSVATLPRYRCGIVIPTDADPRSSMDAIFETMAGRWGWAGGTWRMRAGAMATPSFELDSSWIAQRVQADGQADQAAVVRISNGIPRDQKVNRVTGSCVDPDQRWQVLPYPAVQDAVLIAAEGGEYPLETDHHGVNHVAHAQHLAKVIIRQSQAALRMEALCNLNAYRCELFDVGTITLARYGMADKTAEVTGWRWHPTEGVRLRLAELTAEIFTPVDELVGRDPAPNSNLPPPWDVETITGVVVTSGTEALTDGSVITRTRVAWDAVVSDSIRIGGQIEVQYAEASAATDAQWPSWTEQGSATSATIPGLLTRRHYVFRVRAINLAFNVRGPWSEQVVHLVAEPPTSPDSITAEYSVDGSTGWHTTFTTGDLYARYRFGAGDWSDVVRIVGEDGQTGDHTSFIFKRSATLPATPTGDTPAGWSDAPPADDGNPLWASYAQKTGAGVVVGVWSTPVQISGDDGAPGADGEGLEVQFSVDGATDWHSTFVPGDIYSRWRVGAGAWSDVFKVVGEDGDPGDHTSFIFQRAATIPATPTGDTPAGWSDAPPADDGNPLWASYAQKTGAGVVVGVWSTPVRISGESAKRIAVRSNGGNAFVTSGSGTSWAPSSIIISRELFNGLTTSGATVWTVVSGTFTGSLTVINGTTGAPAAFTPAAMTTDSVTFRCTHTEASVAYFDDITITKTRDGLGRYLSNESITLPANSSGAISSYAGASGNFKLTNGSGDVSTAGGNLAFTIVGYTGFASTYSAPGTSQDSGNITINPITGAYTVAGGVTNAATLATVTFRCTYTNPLGGTQTFDIPFKISKALQGTIGSPGSTGSTGPQGNSARRAYALYSGNPTVTGSAVVKSGTTLPSTTDFSPTAASAFTSTVQTPGSAQAMFQSDGIYDPIANNTTWGTPYLSNLKVGNLSAIVALLGEVKTAVSGARIVLNESGTNTIRGYNSAGTKIYDFEADTGQSTITPTNLAYSGLQVTRTDTGTGIKSDAGSSGRAIVATVSGTNGVGVTATVVSGSGIAVFAGAATGDAVQAYHSGSGNAIRIKRDPNTSGYGVLMNVTTGGLFTLGVTANNSANSAASTTPLQIDLSTGEVSLTKLRINQTPTTGSASAGFTANKPGAAAATCVWVTESYNGTLYDRPLWLH